MIVFFYRVSDPSFGGFRSFKHLIVKFGTLSTTLLIIGFRNDRDNYIKTGQYNKVEDFSYI